MPHISQRPDVREPGRDWRSGLCWTRSPGAGAATLSHEQALVAEAGWMVRETADGKPLLAMPLSMQAKWQAEDKNGSGPYTPSWRGEGDLQGTASASG